MKFCMFEWYVNVVFSTYASTARPLRAFQCFCIDLRFWCMRLVRLRRNRPGSSRLGTNSWSLTRRTAVTTRQRRTSVLSLAVSTAGWPLTLSPSTQWPGHSLQIRIRYVSFVYNQYRSRPLSGPVRCRREAAAIVSWSESVSCCCSVAVKRPVVHIIYHHKSCQSLTFLNSQPKSENAGTFS